MVNLRKFAFARPCVPPSLPTHHTTFRLVLHNARSSTYISCRLIDFPSFFVLSLFWYCLCRRLVRQRDPYAAVGAQWYGPDPAYCKVCTSSALVGTSFCLFTHAIQFCPGTSRVEHICHRFLAPWLLPYANTCLNMTTQVA